MMTPYILENVFRINIAFSVTKNEATSKKDVVMRTFPATKINSNYNFETASTDNNFGKFIIF